MSSDNLTTPLTSLEDTRQALIALVEATRRTLYVYTPYVEPRLYNDTQVIDTLRGRLVAQPRLRIHFLLPPAREWRGSCPNLLQLTDRRRSAIEMRTPPRDEPHEQPELGHGILIADETALLRLLDPRRFVGGYNLQGSPEARELLNFFKELWNKSEPDPELRFLRV